MQMHEKPRDCLYNNFTVVQPPLWSTQILAILRQWKCGLSVAAMKGLLTFQWLRFQAIPSLLIRPPLQSGSDEACERSLQGDIAAFNLR